MGVFWDYSRPLPVTPRNFISRDGGEGCWLTCSGRTSLPAKQARRKQFFFEKKNQKT